jgi:hypothetical protein
MWCARMESRFNDRSVSHMFLFFPLQEPQSCRGELTIRSSFLLGEFKSFWCSTSCFTFVILIDFSDDLHLYSSFKHITSIFHLLSFFARGCFLWLFFFVYLSYENEHGRNVEADGEKERKKRDFWRQWIDCDRFMLACFFVCLICNEIQLVFVCNWDVIRLIKKRDEKMTEN